jgi:hypothetical protein
LEKRNLEETLTMMKKIELEMVIKVLPHKLIENRALVLMCFLINSFKINAFAG